MARLIAIGDVHGQITLLRSLLAALGVVGEDKLVFLGDLIDRGEDSRATLEHVISLCHGSSRVVVLRGNHEQMLLDAVDDVYGDAAAHWLHVGGAKTMRDYDGEVPEGHVEFLRALPLWHRNGRFVFVHAGLRRDAGVTEQLRRGDPNVLLWERDHLKPGVRAWEPGLTVVCGHTIQQEPLIDEQLVCIDTGAARGDSLTAIDLTNALVYQATPGGDVKTRPATGLRGRAELEPA